MRGDNEGARPTVAIGAGGHNMLMLSMFDRQPHLRLRVIWEGCLFVGPETVSYYNDSARFEVTQVRPQSWKY